MKSALWIGTALWAICNLVGLLLTIKGAYQYLFLSADKISDKSTLYGNLYLYISVPGLYLILLLFIVRNALQGYEQPLWPLLSGFAELTARILVCALVPLLFTNAQPLNSESSMWAFAAVMAADAVAWLVSPLVSFVPFLKAMKIEK